MSLGTGIWGDPLAKERFERASAIVISDAGDTLMQKFVNRTVQMLQVRELGLLTVIERRQGSGDKEYINQRAEQSISDSGKWLDDVTPVTSIVGTYSQKSFTYRTWVTRGAISRKMQAVGRSYMDLLALEMAAKAEDFANGLDYYIMYGEFGKAGNLEPVGLITLCENADGATQTADGNHIVNQAQYYSTQAGFVATDSGAGTSYGGVYPFTLEALDKAIDNVKGSANRSDLVIVGSYAGMRQLNAALQSQQRFSNETEIAGGFRVRTYDGIPLIVDTNVSDALTFAGNTPSGPGCPMSGHIKALTGGIGTQFYIMNRRYVYLSELTPTTVVPLARLTSQTDLFDMYWDGAPVIANDYGFAILSNVSTTGEYSTN